MVLWNCTKQLNKHYKYPNLRKLVATAFSLPLKLVKTCLKSSLKRKILVGLMHTNQGIKAMGIYAHQIKLDDMLLELVQKVKSSATNSQAHEIINNELSKIAEN